MESSDSGRVKLESAREARQFSKTHFDAASSRIKSEIPYDQDFLGEPPQEATNYFFSLQSEVEQEGSMDYHEYAKRMWVKFFGEPADESSDAAFALFENRMIANLHSIEMRRIVYPHVTERLETLVDVRGDDIKELVLWSTGDVAATGYQAAKIERSGIVPRYMEAVKRSRPDTVREMMDKTRYMVDDNKFERIADHVEKLQDEGEEETKLVIIEDSVNNFSKVRAAVESKVGAERAKKVKVIPIWATYSREGQQAKAKAESSPEALEEYEARKDSLNGINSFSELLGEKFDDIFKNAHVFVDFDGVIGDNVEMRKQQARVIFAALTEGGLKKGFTIDQVNAQIQHSLNPQEQ